MSWEPINLRHVPDEPPEPPDYLELVYRGRRHWISGPPESLKTLVAYIILLAAVRMGERVPRSSHFSPRTVGMRLTCVDVVRRFILELGVRLLLRLASRCLVSP
jgi:hypothetical protein